MATAPPRGALWPCGLGAGTGWSRELHLGAEPETDDDHGQKVRRRKRGLLELASELGNVSRACRVMGYSRPRFYEIRRNFQTYGADGLLDRVVGARGPHPNRVAGKIEALPFWGSELPI